MAAPVHYRPRFSDDETILDADMTPTDISATLARLRFGRDQPAVHLIGIDSGVRDYLVSALRRRSEPRGGLTIPSRWPRSGP
jgi:hypothetical protein